MAPAIPARDQQHPARPPRRRHREQQLATGLQCVEPAGERMRRAGAGDDAVGRRQFHPRAIGEFDAHQRPGSQRLPRPSGEVGINLDGEYRSLGPRQLRENGGVIAGPTAQMDDAHARADREPIKHQRPEARLSVVDAARTIQRHQHILVERARICAGHGPIVVRRERILDPPWWRPDETLARDATEGLDNSGGAQRHEPSQTLGKGRSRGGNRIHWRAS
ncbi:hypothetical protein OSH12_01100 [Kaistia terrae]|nr:hypothetical protein [Kaistia terrae]MCX5576854.1 hypothetical protein [Kaistia terrae]